jgi:uncharacterized OB-fold protein
VSTLEPQPVGIPAPRPSVRSAGYWQATSRGELTYHRCAACGYVGLRSLVVCADCLGRDMETLTSAGLGSLYSWTVVWRPPDPAFRVPYAPAVVRLDEGFFMVSSVIGCEPEELTAGMELTVEFHPVSDEISLPYFAPSSDRDRP